MAAPNRFTDAVRAALEAELPALHPAVFRPRFFLDEVVPTERLVRILDAIARRGSHGVILKAPDVPDIGAAVDRLDAASIPVVTLVTDLPNTRRCAYVGVDNRQGGATAAYLIGQWLPGEPAAVLVTLSSQRFRGEEEREISFRRELRACRYRSDAPQIGRLKIPQV
jgi:LacI family transcriptional regulator